MTSHKSLIIYTVFMNHNVPLHNQTPLCLPSQIAVKGNVHSQNYLRSLSVLTKYNFFFLPAGLEMKTHQSHHSTRRSNMRLLNIKSIHLTVLFTRHGRDCRVNCDKGSREASSKEMQYLRHSRRLLNRHSERH